MSISHNEFEKIKTKVIARAWKDPRFKEKLMKNPRAVLKEMGIEIPENMQTKVIEEKSNTLTFVLPVAPSHSEELSERELERVVGGVMGVTDAGDSHYCKCK